MSTHTPGPYRIETWSFERRGKRLVVIGGSNALCELSRIWRAEDPIPPEGEIQAEVIANAHLFTAAPDLMTALEACLAAMSGLVDPKNPAWQQANTALAKAKGTA